MRMTKLSLFVLVAFVLGIVLSGCSKPPEAEKEAAQESNGRRYLRWCGSICLC